MSLTANHADLRSIQSFNLFHGSSNPLRVREFRVYRRRRPKRSRKLTLRSEFLPFGDLFASLSSPGLLAPALGVLSGLAAFSAQRGRVSEACDVGEWVLFAAPTPFNRFVLLRCPLVSFEGGELNEGISERLVREDRHYVRLCGGRVPAREGLEGGIADLARRLVYQRVCVSTDDGGVVSLDWPANLDLGGERGLDTTVLVVPGSVQGSMDADVRSFVCEALRRGCFPVVMNPRGCAGSPLTTARLFTAADSDDIRTAVQFINRARPWTTLMGVGWGYGANMLTKYLAEVGEATPVTAAVCIDNPFDLEESTHMGVDQKLTGGLIDILRSNKELFQGRDKGFDIEKALSAKSVREFEQAISMVSYGFEAVDEFYSESSTRRLIGDVKIPVLFIQNDDVSAPLFSIPRSSIVENPFTSLLLCSCNDRRDLYNGGSAMTWYQQLTMEWLIAVELGLLKGRHPLLKDVDVTVNPSKGLAFVEGIKPENANKISKLINVTSSRRYNTEHIHDMLEESDTAAGLILRSREDVPKKYDFETQVSHKADDNSAEQIVPTDEENTAEIESSEGLQTAQLVMNMLDMTLPGTLTEDKKKKVLTAVGQGETVMKALQDAVPEDVREKLNTAVSGILQAQKTQLKMKDLLRISRPSSHLSELLPKIEEKIRETPMEALSQGTPSDLTKTADNLSDGSVKNQPSVEVEPVQSESSQKSPDSVDSTVKGQPSMEIEHLPSEVSQKPPNSVDGTTKSQPSKELEPESSQKPLNSSDDTAKSPPSVEAEHLQPESSQKPAESLDGSVESQPSMKTDISAESNVKENKEIPTLSDSEEESSVKNENAAPSGSSSEAQIVDKEDTTDQKSENKNPDPVVDQIRSNPDSKSPNFSVSQALNALTGIDDSTQVAVNSVFGVIEDMIQQFEEGSPDENGVEDEKMEPGNEYSTELDGSDGSDDCGPHKDGCISPIGFINKEFTENPISSDENDMKKTSPKTDQLVPKSLLHESSNRIKKVDYKLGYVNSFNNASLHDSLSSEIPRESLDSDATSALLLEYFPEEGQWKLLEQPGNNGTKSQNRKTEIADNVSEEFIQFVKRIILDDLRIEVSRKLGSGDIDANLATDLEQVSNAVSMSIVNDVKIGLGDCENLGIDRILEKVDALSGDHVIRYISSAFQATTNLKKILPIGVVLGSSLAALRNYFNIAPLHDDDYDGEEEEDVKVNHGGQSKIEVSETPKICSTESPQARKSDGSVRAKEGIHEENSNKNATYMVGAVTAALGASAFLAQHQDTSQSDEGLLKSSKSSENRKDFNKFEEAISERNNHSLVTSLAEKAMSVAGPVVPTKEGGGVDQERLVTMLAELGQRGGILRLVGKVALLWGGIRGAMSLTERLISFLHLAERPLIQRVLGFACMVLVMWSPIAIPLLPMLVQSWSTKTPSGIAELACIIGLYTAVAMLVMLWGKRVRGYENPSEQYGLDFTSLPKIYNYLMGLIGGVVLVLSIQAVNASLGYLSLSWPYASAPLDAISSVKVFGQTAAGIGQGLVTATGVAFVEELLFRSWLPQEIASDLGYHRGIIISGLVYSLLQRSPWSIPGLWLLSLSLSGIRQRSHGDLSIVIGLRAGILTTSFILRGVGFLTLKPNYSIWLTGTHPLQPFSGITGLFVSSLLALLLYPKYPSRTINTKRELRE